MAFKLFLIIICVISSFFIYRIRKEPQESSSYPQESDKKILVRNPELHQGMEMMFERTFEKGSNSKSFNKASDLPDVHEYLETADEMYIPPEGVPFHPNHDTSREIGITNELNERADRKMSADEIMVLQQEIQEDEEIIHNLLSQGFHERAREIQTMLELKRNRLNELENLSIREE